MMAARGVTKRIRSIRFALLSPDEIRRMSATKIITADTYDDDGFPIDMGLMDSHLGVIEPGLRCLRWVPWLAPRPLKPCRFITPAVPLPLLVPVTSITAPASNTSAVISWPTS